MGEFVYCPRLFHLMDVEGRWADNVYTAEGREVHRRVDELDHVLPDAPPRPEAARRFGLTAGHVGRAATTILNGKTVGQVYERQMIMNVAVWGTERVRSDLGLLRVLPIETPSGALVPLGDVAEVAIAPAPNEIKREDASRRLDVILNVCGRDLGTVAREIDGCVQGLAFEHGYHPEVLGEYAAREKSQRKLLWLSGVAILGILVLLQSDFRSWRLTLLVFLTLPFALIGGVIGAFIAGGVLSLGSLIGFVTVLGIAARNGILLVSHYNSPYVFPGEGLKRTDPSKKCPCESLPGIASSPSTGMTASGSAWTTRRKWTNSTACGSATSTPGPSGRLRAPA